MFNLVYFSGKTNNTEFFLKNYFKSQKLLKIEKGTVLERPSFLVVPTYANHDGSKAVPPLVNKFLGNPGNREKIIGVIGAGNLNFGEFYCLGAIKISMKLNIPLLYKFELRGNSDDYSNMMKILTNFKKG